MSVRKLARLVSLAATACLLALLLVIGAAGAQNTTGSISLTPAEQAWLKEHPIVQVGVFAGDFVPFETWRGGQPEGLGVDYARLLAGRAGLRLEFHPYSDWNGVVYGDENSPPPYDLLLAQPVLPDRMQRFQMLRPFVAVETMLVARRGDLQVRTGADLARARVVIERRFRVVIETVRRVYPGATVVFADSGAQALDMLASGEADAYIGPTAPRTLALINRRQSPDVVSLGPLDKIPTVKLAPAVRRDREELAAILRKAEATVDERDVAQLRQRWGAADTPSLAATHAIGLSADERAWVARLPVLRVGYEVDRYPYSFLNRKGAFDGLAADHIAMLQRKMGLRLQLVPAPDWNTLQRMAMANEVDLIAAGSSGDVDPRDMGFSQPYENFPEVIVARVQGPPMAGPRDLAGRTVAVRDEAGVLSRLRALLPQTRLVPVGSNEAGLSMVASGDADAYVGTLPAIDALIRNRYAAELRVVGPAGMDTELAIGVSRQYAPLLPLIDRMLDSTEDGDRQAIRARWLITDYVYGLPWRWVLLATATVLLVLGVTGLAYVRLRRASRAQVRAEAALAAQLGFQQALLENIPYAVFVKDGEGRYLAVNRAYEAMFGVTREALFGRTAKESMHVSGISDDVLVNEDRQVLATGTSTRRELVIPGVSCDDPPRNVIVWRRALPGMDGAPDRLMGTIVEITDIRAAEARARASEQRLHDISQAMPGTVFQMRVEPEGDRRFTYVAGDVKGMLGMSAEEIIGHEATAFVRLHPDDQPRVRQAVETAARTLQPVPAFDVRILVDDRWRWLRTEGGPPRQLADGAVEWSGYWVDTTALHEQARALDIARLQAESAVAAKGTFLAAMSHEIRTPMTGVLGLIELLTQTRLDHEQSSMASMARDSAKALLQILDDILDYSRIESGRLSIEASDFDLRELMDSVAGLFGARARDTGDNLYSIADWRLATRFRGDAMRVRQIITNLLSNAVKFTAQGQVALQARLLDEKGDRQHLRIEVVDTGIGIAPENLARLFQPFTQAEDSTTRRFGGTGLGLAISRRLAEMMDGHLDLASKPGAGTRAVFELVLPVVQPLRPRPEFEGKTAALCVADELRAQELGNGLSSFGFSLVEVEPADLVEFDADGVDLLVADGTVPVPASLATCPVISVACAQEPLPLDGHAQTRVHGNPQSQRSLLRACHHALGLQDDEPSWHGDATASEGVRGARILVAEDHPINRAVIGRQLERLGYAHVMACNGEEALQELARGHYDLLITDCHMPVMDGYALTRAVRAMPSDQARLPVIGLSASVLPEQIQRCRDAGMDDFLAKPIQVDALAAKLGAFLHATPAPATVDDDSVGGLDRLRAMYGSPDEFHRVLQELVAISRRELDEFDAAMVAGDAARQRDLLHRIEGALTLVGIGTPSAEGLHDIAERRTAVVATLEEIESILREEMTRATDVDG